RSRRHRGGRAAAREGIPARARRWCFVRHRRRFADRAASHARAANATQRLAVHVMRRWLVCIVLAACGDNLLPHGELTIVGHSDLNARGMNAAIALADDVAYVGSRIDKKGVAIVDISDPTHPSVVGEIGPPDEGVSGMSSRELRAIPELNALAI